MLSPLQERVARTVAALPAAEGFALAGGAALVAAEVVDRETRDLDYFGASAGDVETIARAAHRALLAEGLDVTVQVSHPGFVRLEVADGRDATELDFGVDARMRPVQAGRLGPTLAIEELAADKLLALFGRAQARDFVDVHALVERLGLEKLCQLAAEKDPGFSRHALADMLASFGRYTAEDLDLDTAGYQRLTRAVADWSRTLAPTSRRPPADTDGPPLGL